MPRESKDALKKRTAEIIRLLKKAYPDAKCALDHANPLQLLVATILSAQCTDERVNVVTKDLFRRYRTASDYAEAEQEELEQAIRSTGFFRNKAKSIRGSARMIAEKHGGSVPSDMDALLELPGVARKTANVVLGTAFGRDVGIVVDTHVQRLSQRLKLTMQTNNQGDKMERDLMGIVPQEEWTMFAHLLIFHGRRCCTARKPNCAGCPVSKLCPSAFKV